MDLFSREKYLSKIRGFYESEDIIKVITGIRGCGKSSLMMMITDELRKQGISDDRILYFNLDERKYRKVKDADSLEEMISTHIQAHVLNYLFIDEVQNVQGFEEVINGFREEGNCSQWCQLFKN